MNETSEPFTPTLELTTPLMDFVDFPKMARLTRPCHITEKLDGTNAQVYITEDGDLLTGSRTRYITPEDDNYGFARWAYGNKSELLKLGPGRHFGEWWGNGIQRGYGLKEKRFSLFNTLRWTLYGTEPRQIPNGDPRIVKMQDVLPECVGLVPLLYTGVFSTLEVDIAVERLRQHGSMASQGFMKPEGVIVYHVAGGVGFKKTLEKDDVPKTSHKS